MPQSIVDWVTQNKHDVIIDCFILLQDVVETLGNVPSDSNTAIPKHKVRIVDSGLNVLDKKYTLTEKQLDSTEDL